MDGMGKTFFFSLSFFFPYWIHIGIWKGSDFVESPEVKFKSGYLVMVFGLVSRMKHHIDSNNFNNLGTFWGEKMMRIILGPRKFWHNLGPFFLKWFPPLTLYGKLAPLLCRQGNYLNWPDYTSDGPLRFTPPKKDPFDAIVLGDSSAAGR